MEEITRTNVVIIGGGAAGIGAGEILKKENIDFVIIEAQGEIGGRIQKYDFSGIVVENGANWIHGQFDKEYCDDAGQNCGSTNKTPKFINSIWEYQENEHGSTNYLEGSFTNYDMIKMIDHEGRHVPQEEIEKCLKQIESAGARCRELEVESDMTIRECYENNMDLTGLNKKACDCLLWLEVEFETGIFDVSLKHRVPLNSEKGIPYNDRDFLVTDRRGYQSILESISASFSNQILFNQKVIEVSYTKQGVKVKTEKGTEIEADYAICTVSLGVLQQKGIRFIPDFNQEKKDAISRLEMGFYAKIYITFPTKFWGDEEALMYISEKQPHESIMTWCLNLDHPKYFPGSRMLTCHSMGETAKRVESQDIDVTKDEINKIMGKMFKHVNADDRTVVDIHVTNWSSNPLFYGAYSEVPVGTTQRQRDLVRENVDRLYFAGEHTSNSNGFVHSAYDTGKAVSQQILKDMSHMSVDPIQT